MKNEQSKINYMKYYVIIILFLLLFVQTTFAQRGIGTNTPNEHSVLELVSNNKGLLLPRLSLTSSVTFLNGSATASDNSLLVYNTNTATNTGLSGPGFYYWAGAATVNLNSGFPAYHHCEVWNRMGTDQLI